MSLVQALKPHVSQMNNNLMPPPATVKDSTAEEKAGKNLKFRGLYDCMILLIFFNIPDVIVGFLVVVSLYPVVFPL